jgi:hypothetical protein
MKFILLLVAVAISTCSMAQSSYTINSMADFFKSKISQSVDQVFIVDENEGGLFFKYIGNEPVDSGVIISDASGKKFKRQYNNTGAITPLWWGAKGDGIADDLPALNKATKFLKNSGGIIDLKNKYYRITDTWIVGAKFIDEKYAYFSNPTASSHYNHTKYMEAISKKPIKIIATGGYAGIYGDFQSDSPKAIIYYNLYGDTRATPSAENYVAEISNIGIYAKGAFVNGKPKLVTSASGFSYSSNQMGILALFTFQMLISNVTCYGLKEGIVMNNSYFSKITTCYFKLCQTGIYHIQSHGSIIDNPTAYFCKKGYEIRSGQISMNNINTEQCPLGLHIINGSNVVNGAYLESNRTGGKAQLIIGDDSGYACEGVILNAVTTASTKPDGTVANGVLLKKTARTVIINGGAISGCERDSSISTLLMTGVSGGHPSWVYERGADITSRNIIAAGAIVAKGSLSAPSLNAPVIKATTINAAGNVSIDGELKQKSGLGSVIIKSKIIKGLGGSSDYIIRLGKYAESDSSRIQGVLSILGNSVYTACGFININYVNEVNGMAKASFTSMTDTKNISVSLIKFMEGGKIWAGIRFKTAATQAWLPYYFLFNGAVNNDAVSFSAIATSSVTDIVPLLANDSRYELNANKIITPNLKSNTPGVKKPIYVDEFGNWSVQ